MNTPEICAPMPDLPVQNTTCLTPSKASGTFSIIVSYNDKFIGARDAKDKAFSELDLVVLRSSSFKRINASLGVMVLLWT